jgi:GNAT superfamily N-acetyltransferase
VRITELNPEDPRIADMLPVLTELRPHLTPASFDAIYREGWPQGLRFVAAFDDDGSCLGVAGWRINALTIDGRKLYVDDLVTSAAVRSTGVGHALLTYLEDRAKAAGCAVIDLDSGVQRHDAHRFYLRERMAITSHHFAKRLENRTSPAGD